MTDINKQVELLLDTVFNKVWDVIGEVQDAIPEAEEKAVEMVVSVENAVRAAVTDILPKVNTFTEVVVDDDKAEREAPEEESQSISLVEMLEVVASVADKQFHGNHAWRLRAFTAEHVRLAYNHVMEHGKLKGLSLLLQEGGPRSVTLNPDASDLEPERKQGDDSFLHDEADYWADDYDDGEYDYYLSSDSDIDAAEREYNDGWRF